MEMGESREIRDEKERMRGKVMDAEKKESGAKSGGTSSFNCLIAVIHLEAIIVDGDPDGKN